MTAPPRVVAVCGSRRTGSYTRDALRVALDGASEAGAETRLLDLGDDALDLPLYHPDEDPTADLESLMAAVRAAEGVVVGSPVYHGSYSSAFKSFHDWCGSDEYEDTVVGLLAVAGGGSYASTLDHLRATVRGVHGWVVPHQVGIRGARNEIEDGAFVDDGLRDRTRRLGREVARAAAGTPVAEVRD